MGDDEAIRLVWPFYWLGGSSLLPVARYVSASVSQNSMTFQQPKIRPLSQPLLALAFPPLQATAGSQLFDVRLL